MDYSRLFGRRLRAVRKSAKLTQEKLAEAARLNPKYLGQLERGEKRPSFDVIASLAKALRTTPATFFLFEREETDERVLRRKIDSVLQKCSSQQLQQIHRILTALVDI
jgi:transcriptional regulator with XRE-family HTH domain